MFQNIKTLKNYHWLVFGVISLGTFMATLDGSIVNIALPKISSGLGSDMSLTGWVITSYLLTISSLLLLWGKAGDVFGRKFLYNIGFLLFTIGSIFCALSGTIWILIGARIFQAIGASLLMANSSAIIADVFTDRTRGRALGLTGTTVAIGTMSGPAIGGLLLGKFGWASIFYLNIPIGIISFIIAHIILPETKKKAPEKYDILGAVLFASAIICLCLFLSKGHQWGWLSDKTISFFSASAVLLVLFCKQELKIKYPLINFNLFKNRTFLFGNIAAFFSFMAMFSNIVLFPFYLDKVLHLEPLYIGLLIMPFPIMLAMIAPLSGYLSEKHSMKKLTFAGLFLTTLGMLYFSRIDQDSSYLSIVIGQMILGTANGLFQAPNNNSITSSVSPSMYGVSSGISALVRNLGMICGITLSITTFESYRNYLLHQPQVYSATDLFIIPYHKALFLGAVYSAIGALICLAKDSDKKPLTFKI